MKILALEFSSAQRSVAVLDSEQGSRFAIAEEAGGRSTHAFAMIEEALRKEGAEREQIAVLAVGIGPGSYNGVRMAIALAQGWQLANKVKILGVSATDCLARQARQMGLRGNVQTLIDAQRNEFYLAGYKISDTKEQIREPLRLASLAEVQSKIDAKEIVIGPEASDWFPVAKSVFPSALSLAQLASARGDFVSGDKLEPIYLRPTAFIKAPPPRIIPTT